MYLLYDHLLETKEQKRITHERIVSLREQIPEQIYIIKPTDINRLHDCAGDDDSPSMEWSELKGYKFMELFSGKTDPLNGFLLYGKYPVYNYIHGLDELDENTTVLIGIRGNTAGPHRSLVTPQLYKLYKKFKSTIIYMPGMFYSHDGTKTATKDASLQSVCHGRKYQQNYIGGNWPGVSDGNSWRLINKIFKDKTKLFIFAYSNGQVVKEDFIRTAVVNQQFIPQHTSISNAFEFLEDYDSKTHFVNEQEMHRIGGIVDIETNYSTGIPLWNLGKFIKDHIDGVKGKIYYAACGLDSAVAYSHVTLIQALGLSGIELGNGVVRYMNDSRNVIIDILTMNTSTPYSYGKVNLLAQTRFLKDTTVGHRLQLTHYTIVPYAIDQFGRLAAERRILIE